MTYKEIACSKDWCVIKQIHKGWSKDKKFYIETIQDEKLLLRLLDITHYEAKKKEFSIMEKYSKLGFEMSRPLEFGTCDENRFVYILCTWVEGEDLSVKLPTLSEDAQYELGRKAGQILRKIHTLKVSDDELPKVTKIPHKQNQIERYEQSSVRVENDEIALTYIRENLSKIWQLRPTYLHGDFHPGNLILTPTGELGVIDFNRWEIGDPYEEFYKLESFGIESSIPYCMGEIESYFDDEVPQAFWEILAVYVAHAALFSIKWAEKFGQDEVDEMVKRCQRAFVHYDEFRSVIPSWYAKGNWDFEKLIIQK